MVNIVHNHKVRFLALPFVGGFLYALGFPSKMLPQFFGLSIIGMYLLLSTFRLSFTKDNKEPSLKRDILSLLCFSCGYCLTGYYWVPYTMSEFGGIFFPFNYLIGLSFSLIIVPQILIFILLHNIVERIKFKSSPLSRSIGLKILLYAFAMSLLEYIVPQQFPAHLGHPWLQLAPYLGMAPFVGAPVYSFFSYLLIFAFIAFMRTNHKDYLSVISFFVFLALNLLIPLNPITPETTVLETNIRLVQANVGNFMKMQSENGSVSSIQEIHKRYFELSTKPGQYKPDLLIWPETAYPKLQKSKLLKDNVLPTPDLINKVIESTNAELFTGGYDSTSDQYSSFESEYNSAFLFGDEGKFKSVYHKMILIPFGESLPFGPFNKYLSQIVSNIAFFASGDDYTIFKTRNGGTFTSAICYEILFSNFIRTYLNKQEQQPNYLINLTNDSWYGDTAEPYQHLFLAKWRALEFNIPIVRMTNTGISSVIYPDGNESRRTGILKQEILDVRLVSPNREKTLFQKLGIFTLVIVWLIHVLIGNIILMKSSKTSDE